MPPHRWAARLASTTPFRQREVLPIAPMGIPGDHEMQGPDDFDITRRDLLILAAASVAATAMPLATNAEAPVSEPPVMAKVSFEVNGKPCALEIGRASCRERVFRTV